MFSVYDQNRLDQLQDQIRVCKAEQEIIFKAMLRDSVFPTLKWVLRKAASYGQIVHYLCSSELPVDDRESLFAISAKYGLGGELTWREYGMRLTIRATLQIKHYWSDKRLLKQFCKDYGIVYTEQAGVETAY